MSKPKYASSDTRKASCLPLTSWPDFIAVAEELHFGRAAERLNMTQPPLSRQIQKLERSVGAELLERDNRKVQLTAAGHAFLEDARRLLALAERAPVTARRIASGRSGHCASASPRPAGFSILGPLLEEISAMLPDVDIDLQEMVTGEQIQALQNGRTGSGAGTAALRRRCF